MALHIMVLMCSNDRARIVLEKSEKLQDIVNLLSSPYVSLQKTAIHLVAVLCSSEKVRISNFGDFGVEFIYK